jgi:hypothetical protein
MDARTRATAPKTVASSETSRSGNSVSPTSCEALVILPTDPPGMRSRIAANCRHQRGQIQGRANPDRRPPDPIERLFQRNQAIRFGTRRLSSRTSATMPIAP